MTELQLGWVTQYKNDNWSVTLLDSILLLTNQSKPLVHYTSWIVIDIQDEPVHEPNTASGDVLLAGPLLLSGGKPENALELLYFPIGEVVE